MSNAEKLISDIHQYLKQPNALRAEVEANGRKSLSPDPEEQNLTGYEISKLDPTVRIASLAWSTAKILKSGPDFYRKVDGIYVYKGLKTAKEDGLVGTIRVSSMPEVEFIARNEAASEVSQDSSIKFIGFQDRPNMPGKENDSLLTLAWEEKDGVGDLRLKREIIVFGSDGVFRERSYLRQDRSGVTTIKLPLSDVLQARVENVLLGIQYAASSQQPA